MDFGIINIVRGKVGQFHLRRSNQKDQHYSQGSGDPFSNDSYVIRTASITLVIVLNCFMFFPMFHKLQFHQANMPQTQLPFSSYILIYLVVLQGLNVDKFYSCDYRIYLQSLFNSWRQNILVIITVLLSSSKLKSKGERCVFSSRNNNCIGVKAAL